MTRNKIIFSRAATSAFGFGCPLLTGLLERVRVLQTTAVPAIQHHSWPAIFPLDYRSSFIIEERGNAGLAESSLFHLSQHPECRSKHDWYRG